MLRFLKNSHIYDVWGFVIMLFVVFFYFNCIFTESKLYSGNFRLSYFLSFPTKKNLTKQKFILNVTLKTYQELNVISCKYIILSAARIRFSVLLLCNIPSSVQKAERQNV